jgi:hypothetical protein
LIQQRNRVTWRDNNRAARLSFETAVLPSKPKPQLEAENAALRQQVAILQRKVRGRVQLTNSDRLFFVLLYRWVPPILKTITISA